MADTARTQKKSNWIASNRMMLTAVVVVAVAVTATLGLASIRPHSFKMEVLVANLYPDAIQINIYVDNVPKTSMSVLPGDYKTVGVWSVSEGSHTAAVNYSWGDCTFCVTYEHFFDLPSTKTVWVGLGPTIHVRW